MAEKTDIVLDPKDELTRDRFQAALSEELASEVQGPAGDPAAMRFGDTITFRFGEGTSLKFGDGPPARHPRA
jgi:hypothetical protein